MSFAERDGLPFLCPDNEAREVSFTFEQRRSAATEAFERCFRYPTRAGATGADHPYHLDVAHADVIDALPQGARILEVGCGGGQMRSHLESHGFRYVGIDISKTRVDEELRAHGGPDLLCDAHFLPFRSESFDLVYTSALTEHLACPLLAAQEIRRVLRPGGYYLGNVSFLEPWHDDSFFHLSPLGVFELLTQANFEIVHIWPGKGYSGFRAIMAMGNKATVPLVGIGDFIHLIYKSGARARDIVKRRSREETKDGIHDAARVAGATDWIARRPVPMERS
jgi:SAM-dependent methyltransferase